jgi:hypothetical protein
MSQSRIYDNAHEGNSGRAEKVGFFFLFKVLRISNIITVKDKQPLGKGETERILVPQGQRGQSDLIYECHKKINLDTRATANYQCNLKHITKEFNGELW